MYYIDSSPREPRFVLVPLRFASEAWPRAGLGEPRSASNANKPAASWPLKQGRKKCSKHGCHRETSTVCVGVGLRFTLSAGSYWKCVCGCAVGRATALRRLWPPEELAVLPEGGRSSFASGVICAMTG